MVIVIIILIILGIAILSKLVYNRVQNEIYHDVIVSNLFLQNFLSSSDYLAIWYAKRAGLDTFEIIPVENLSSKKRVRQYFRTQNRCLSKLKDCFKCSYAVTLFSKNPNIESLMDLERTCIHHTFCSLCPSRWSCQAVNTLSEW
jgi:hypothetical protein